MSAVVRDTLARAGELIRAGHFEAAIRLLADLPAPARQDPEVRTLTGIAQFAAGRTDDGIRTLEATLEESPGHVPALFNLGVAHLRRQEAERAAVLLQRAAERVPDSAEILQQLAIAQSRSGCAEAAGRNLEHLLRLQPGNFDGRRMLASLLVGQGRVVEAETLARQTLRDFPANPDAFRLFAATMIPLGFHDEVLAVLAEAQRRWPAEARWLLAVHACLRALYRLPEALAVAERFVAAQPEVAEGWANLCEVRRDLGELDAAVAAGRRAVALAPGNAAIRFGLAWSLLRAGDYAEGWQAYESRWQGTARLAGVTWPAFSGRPWNGEPLAGKTLLVWHEQGFGDSLQMARYLTLLVARGARVVYRLPAPLLRLFSGIDGIAVVGATAPLPPHDFHCPNMSLPRLFGTTLESIPPPRLDLADFPNPVPELDLAGSRPRVGIVWRGSLDRHDPRGLSDADVEHLVAALPGCELFSLQVGGSTLPESCSYRVRDLAPQLADFADTAAVLRRLDLLVSVDTAALHLAGSLGCPAFGLLMAGADWRWFGRPGGTEGSPWYPEIRLFRQGGGGNWRGAIDALAAAVGEHFAPDTAAGR